MMMAARHINDATKNAIRNPAFIKYILSFVSNLVMSNLTEYCDRVRWINDPVATQQHIAGYSINQIFFVACLVKCILHLRRLRSHAAREGNFSRQGRTRAIVAALLACLCGIAYSTVIFAYKLLLINEENGRPRKIHDYMRWSYRTLQTMTLCL